MRKLGLVLALFGSTLSAFGSKGVSVADLERTLIADRGKPDAQITQQLSGFQLTERLSSTTLARLQSLAPGPQTAQELRILADQSEFLPLPSSELPPLPAPEFAEQRRIMALVVNYVSKTIHELPNFYATRVTTSFEEKPLIQTGTYSIPYQPLHAVGTTETTVLYRDGREVVQTAKSASNAAKPLARGLNASGVFGPILSTVFLDAAKGKLSWSHWEQLPAGKRAVFQYAVPQQNSQYQATYCCIPGVDPGSAPTKPFDRVVGYHGEITVDPLDGSILRLTVQADLKPSDPIQRADIMVEYGPVEIGGKTYICATRSIALSSALSQSHLRGNPGLPDVVTQGPPQTLLNDVAFDRYHMFRADVRILTADETQEPPAPSATPASPEVAAAFPNPQPAKEPETAAQIAVAATPERPASPPPTPEPNPSPAPATDDPNLKIRPVFKLTTHLVIVDVVATKPDGQPLQGLTKEDFEVKENGKPQTINLFQQHTSSDLVQSAPPEMPAMPARTRTNVPPAPPADAVNVLLIDTLNTEVNDQATVRKLVIHFLTKLPQGPRFAIFSLGSQLRCLQGFTSDSSAVLAALNDAKNGLKVNKDRSFKSQNDKASDAADIAELQTEQASPFAIAALQAAVAGSDAQKVADRASMTYEALMYLGNYLSGIPGRKNLIWFAGSFPTVVVPNAGQLAALARSAHPQDLVRVKRTAELFTAAQIAIYPISSEGLAVSRVGEATAYAPGGGGGHQGGQDAGAITSSYSPETANSTAMEQLAASTGGKAFFNTNDLGGALKHAIDDGSHYYTIGYSPADKNMDGSYRKIEVKAVHGKNKLAYRRGYIATAAATPAAKAKIDPFPPLLRLGLPGATGILYGARAEPAATQPSPGDAPAGQNPNLNAPTVRYTVDFVIRSQDLSLQRSAQGEWTGKLLLGLKAYDLIGNALNWSADEETLAIPPDQLVSLRTTGITAQVDIDLPQAADIHLVTAVYDPASATGGTLEIPLQTAGK